MHTSRSRTLKSRYASEKRSYLFWGDRPLGKQGLLRADDHWRSILEAALLGASGRGGQSRTRRRRAIRAVRYASPGIRACRRV